MRGLDQASHPIKMLQPADDDLLEVFPVTRDPLKIKAPDTPVLAIQAIARCKSRRRRAALSMQ